MGLYPVLQIGANQDGLAGKIHLRLHLGFLVQPEPGGFLGENFATDQFLAHRFAQFGAVGSTLGTLFGEHNLEPRGRKNLAIDGGRRFRGLGGKGGQAGHEGQGETAGQCFHRFSLSMG
jgi:hypothetical protein